MENVLFFSAGTTAASRYAADELKRRGIPFVGHISPEITHLLLDVPSFGGDGQLRNGGNIERLLRMLPSKLTVVGGNLSHPALEERKTQDLLQDAEYTARNAWITAECALQVAAPLMTSVFRDAPVLITGWGRIGKCLARILKGLGCDVTVAARKASDRAMLRTLGFHAVEPASPTEGYRVIFNTVPEMILPQEKLALCKDCIKIDLASRRGMEGQDVVWARGLPGIHAPESSGLLIAETVIRLLKEEAT